MVEVVAPVTRFRIAPFALGWAKLTLLAAPMAKLDQLITARSLVWVTVIAPPPDDPIVAAPLITAPPVGKASPAWAMPLMARTKTAVLAALQRSRRELRTITMEYSLGIEIKKLKMHENG